MLQQTTTAASVATQLKTKKINKTAVGWELFHFILHF
jgi:hypothetical protein